MTVIHTITADAVVGINKLICAEGGNRHQCYGIGKVESALHSAFYPGGYPFQHGGVSRVAGALCFYLTQAHAFYDGSEASVRAKDSAASGKPGALHQTTATKGT